MARIARVVIPQIPHHVIQRGNRRLPTFFKSDDFSEYLRLLGEFSAKHEIEIWAYCLMTNHVHFVDVPSTEDGLCKFFGEVHRRYTRYINFREEWRGHLWQERFSSFPMDERYLLVAVRYIERNPVKAGIVQNAWDYPWSSAKAHMQGKDNEVVCVQRMLERVPNWKTYLETGDFSEAETKFLLHERTGRPLGERPFLLELEAKLNRPFIFKKPGRKSKQLELMK